MPSQVSPYKHRRQDPDAEDMDGQIVTQELCVNKNACDNHTRDIKTFSFLSFSKYHTGYSYIM